MHNAKKLINGIEEWMMSRHILLTFLLVLPVSVIVLFLWLSIYVPKGVKWANKRMKPIVDYIFGSPVLTLFSVVIGILAAIFITAFAFTWFLV